MKLTIYRKKARIVRIILWTVLFIGLLGVGVVTMLYLNGQQATTPSKDAVPAAHKPVDNVGPSVFSDTPAALHIASLGINAPIKGVGLTEGGQMEAPNNNIDVGWYTRSARIGIDSQYSVLLDGHYGTDRNNGVFYNLHKIKEGEAIEIQGESGRAVRYEVKEIERRKLEDVDMNKAFKVYPGAKQSVTLITCEGEYDPARNTYNDRVVVYAVRV